MAFPFDASTYRSRSQRRVVFARGGMVCSTQPLAAQAGLDVLRRGGNAVDAAIATAAALTVIEPTSNGIGGDAFAQIWMDGKLYGLNSSGPAPALADADSLRRHYSSVPENGWYPVNVPGIPAAWAEASRRFGCLPFHELFSSAISYAEGGYPVAPVTAALWREGFSRFWPLRHEELFRPWFETFAPDGAPLSAGDIAALPRHAETLRELAASGCESFYRGAIAQKIDAFSRETGGWLRAGDLEAFRPEWVEPICVDYRGYRVWELPPNGHGLVVLMTLGILGGFPRLDGSVESVHRAIEAMKLAYADGRQYIAERRAMPYTTEQLLDSEYLASRRALIGLNAIEPAPGRPYCGGTVYFCTADSYGNMVSWIQSNYDGFGSGVVVPGTGIALHNRGCNFSLDPASPNCLAPGKRPYHTIIPGFLTKDGAAVGPFGVMGAFMQPQGHVQVLINMLDLGMNPQEALDMPRWQWTGGKRIELESDFPASAAAELRVRGHDTVRGNSLTMGRGQIIWRDERGVLCGATEPRGDGGIASF